MNNLFSVLSREQIESLSDEERRSLAKVDEKLFPHADKESNKGSKLFQNWQQRNEATLHDKELYAQQMEASFAR